jgi:DNA-binding PucR family transcriptional regulator
MPKSSAYPPLDGLVDLACRDGVDIRPTLLRVLTDLYVQKPIHSTGEEIQYVELALGLIDAVDPATRSTVAARLSAYRRAPQAVLQKLGRTPAAPAAGPAARPEPKPASGLELAELFFAAGTEERRLILTNLDAVAAANPARRTLPVSHELTRRLENAALQRNAGEFVRTLERALGLARSLAERIVGDPSGEPIVVAAKGIGMKADVLQRILLFLNPEIGQSIERVYDLALLFDEITQAAAELMLSIWRQSSPRPQAGHAPVYWDDERRSARVLANPLPHRAVRKQDVGPPATKSKVR